MTRHSPAPGGAPLDARQFLRRFTGLIAAAWMLSPVIGLAFLVEIDIFTVEQVWAIMFTPLESAFILANLLLAAAYFTRYVRPVARALAEPKARWMEQALQRMRRFPLHFWGLFTVYLLLASSTVTLSAELYTDYTITDADWLRIQMAALIVSILVGLPIFFCILDLFGRSLGAWPLARHHVSLKTKVFLLGALVPLLVDTVLVQYYWSRTDYFNAETFAVWLILELLAVAGALMVVRSLSQALSPLHDLLDGPGRIGRLNLTPLSPRSTDELGVLTAGYRRLLEEIKVHNEVLRISNRILRGTWDGGAFEEVMGAVLDLTTSALGDDHALVLLHDPADNTLSAVAQTGAGYAPQGHFRLPMDQPSLARTCFLKGVPVALTRAHGGLAGDAQLHTRFGMRSALAAPLRIEGRVMGVLISVCSHDEREYNDQETALMEGFAGEAALAVHTQLLYRSRASAEARLREREELFRLLLESSGEGIIGIDPQLRCSFANQAAAQMLGYRVEELVGQNIPALIHHSNEDGHRLSQAECFIYRTVHQGRAFHSEDEVLWHREGRAIPVQVSANPIHEHDRVRGAVIIFRDVAEARALVRKMDYLATHDPLTGLVNRREFERRVRRALESARTDGAIHALCYLDLDQFKVVNDTCGHVAGDELLRQLTMVLNTHMRRADTLARLGGDEFGVLFERCPLDQALRLAGELRGSVQDFRFAWKGKTFAVGVSIGVVALTAETDSLDTAMSAADAACYMAKEGGRNRVHVYQPDDEELARRQGEMHWVARIHEALDRDLLELTFQPIIALQEKTTARNWRCWCACAAPTVN